MIQFSFSMMAKKRNNKQQQQEEEEEDEKHNNKLKFYFNLFVSTQGWFILLQLLTQDLPGLIIRIIFASHTTTMQSLNAYQTPAATYSLNFFILKNAFLVIMEVYKLFVLIRKKQKKQKLLTINNNNFII